MIYTAKNKIADLRYHILKDFKEVEIFKSGKPYRKKMLSQDKGRKEEVRVFIEAVKEGKGDPIPFEEIYSTSLVTFKVLESLRTGESVKLNI